jgi:hypothetical protein
MNVRVCNRRHHLARLVSSVFGVRHERESARFSLFDFHGDSEKSACVPALVLLGLACRSKAKAGAAQAQGRVTVLCVSALRLVLTSTPTRLEARPNGLRSTTRLRVRVCLLRIE